MPKYEWYKNNLRIQIWDTMAKKVQYNTIKKHQLLHRKKKWVLISRLFASMDHCEDDHQATSCCSEKITEEMDHLKTKTKISERIADHVC